MTSRTYRNWASRHPCLQQENYSIPSCSGTWLRRQLLKPELSEQELELVSLGCCASRSVLECLKKTIRLECKLHGKAIAAHGNRLTISCSSSSNSLHLLKTRPRCNRGSRSSSRIFEVEASMVKMRTVRLSIKKRKWTEQLKNRCGS